MSQSTLLGGAPLAAFAAPLSAWYRENARPLPWRENTDPYRVWLSEVMLQQTRIEAVKPYYARFLSAAPTVQALAALPDDRLMKLWEGLGYYSRARNLRRAAQEIVAKHNGEMPRDHAALLALPGIGEYTAGAIASIAFGLPYPAVDGNVLRVLTRLLADPSDVLLPETKKRITALLGEVYRQNEENSATLTQGLMELGQTLCLPNTAPLCDACPLAPFCRARAEDKTCEIPYRAPKRGKRTERRLVLLLLDGEGRYAIRRRAEDGLLGGLWELPNLLITGEEDDGALDRLARDFCTSFGLLAAESAAAPAAKHIFTHLVWEMRGRFVNVRSTEAGELLFVTPEELRSTYALPSAFRAYARVIYGQK